MDFKDIVQKFIAPLFSIKENVICGQESLERMPQSYCSIGVANQILILRREKIKNGDKIELKRTQAFSVEERSIANEFLRFLNDGNLYNTVSELDFSVYPKVLELTMLKTVMPDISNDAFFRDLSFLFDYWSNRTYEGNKISFAIKVPKKIEENERHHQYVW